jgi:hypothetical protein
MVTRNSNMATRNSMKRTPPSVHIFATIFCNNFHVIFAKGRNILYSHRYMCVNAGAAPRISRWGYKFRSQKVDNLFFSRHPFSSVIPSVHVPLPSPHPARQWCCRSPCSNIILLSISVSQSHYPISVCTPSPAPLLVPPVPHTYFRWGTCTPTSYGGAAHV